MPHNNIKGGDGLSSVPVRDLIARGILYGECALSILEADRACGPATGYNARVALAHALEALVGAEVLLLGAPIEPATPNARVVAGMKRGRA